MTSRKTKALTLIPALISAVALGVVLGAVQAPFWLAMVVCACFVVGALPALLVANGFVQPARD